MTSTFSKKYLSDPEYYERHKKYMNGKTVCECGSIVVRCNMSHHKKSKKHIKYINDKVDYSEEIKKINDKIDKIIEIFEMDEFFH